MTVQTDVWQSLKESRKPILLYGMGNGADKILSAMDAAGIPFADTFASDGFVRGQFFHGKRVISYSEAKEKYGDFAVLLSFGSARPEVLEAVERIEREREVLAPDVPVCGGEIFTLAFYLAHREELNEARALLADDFSKRVFDEIIAYKLDGKLSHLRAVTTDQSDDLRTLFPDDFTAYIDLGAYTGDTVQSVFASYPSVRKIVVFEPSVKCYEKLCARLAEKDFYVFPCGTTGFSPETASGHSTGCRDGSHDGCRDGSHDGCRDGSHDGCRDGSHDGCRDGSHDGCHGGRSDGFPAVYAWNLAAWNEEKNLSFSDGGARNSSVSAVNDKEKSGAKFRTVTGGTPDSRCSFENEKLLIKYDVEGAEREALLGSEKLISSNRTSLIVSCYHKSEDLFRLPLLIRRLAPGHALYLRKHIGFPAWDINLYCREK